QTATNQDGRCDAPLLSGPALTRGVYELVFHAGDYFARKGVPLPEPRFVDQVVLRFGDRKSTRLNSSHVKISYAVFCLKKIKELCPPCRGTGRIQELVVNNIEKEGLSSAIHPRREPK